MSVATNMAEEIQHLQQPVMRVWQPDLELAEIDRHRLAVYLRCSTLSTVNDSDPARLPEVESLLSVCDDDPLAIVHPEYFALQFVLQDKVEKSDSAGFAEAIDELPQVLEEIRISRKRAAEFQKRIGVCVDLEQFSNDRVKTVDRVLAMTRDTFGVQALDDFRHATEDHLNRIRDTFSFIKEVWPEAFEEFSKYVQCLYLFESNPNRIIGFSDWYRHGSIFMRLKGMDDLVWYAEQLLHEAAHVRLNTILASTPLFTNDDSILYKSPLRPDPRPMFGVFHQMFVLSRMSEYFGRVARVTDRYAKRQEATNLHLIEAVALVNREADLTAEGRYMVDSIAKVAAAVA